MRTVILYKHQRNVILKPMLLSVFYYCLYLLK
nr:MAG TPA: hypothetical protein [Caudoviricetes sp.]DAS52702.1 MAG TPA: hypothetical protein [Caudoviricetes sp.]